MLKKRANFALPREFQPGQRGKSPQILRSNVNLEFEQKFLHSLGHLKPLASYKLAS